MNATSELLRKAEGLLREDLRNDFWKKTEAEREQIVQAVMSDPARLQWHIDKFREDKRL